MVAQAGVARQAGGGALVAAVHGHEVDVDVDDEVALGSPLAELHVLAVGGLAEHHHAVGVLGVVVVEAARRGEGVVDAVADGMAQLVLGHPPVDGQRSDEVHVVDAGLCGQVEDSLDDPLTDVGPAHRRQGQRDVVEGDGELHAGMQQCREGFGVAQRVEECAADGAVGVGEPLERLGRVDHPGAIGRQLLEPESLAVVEQDRWAAAVDVEDEAGSGGEVAVAHLLISMRASRSFSSRRSKATLTAPRRPAAAACSSASR